MARTATIKLRNNMAAEIKWFCFVYMHDNQLYHRVKSRCEIGPAFSSPAFSVDPSSPHEPTCIHLMGGLCAVYEIRRPAKKRKKNSTANTLRPMSSGLIILLGDRVICV